MRGTEVRETALDWARPLVRREATRELILHHEAGEGSAEDIHRYHLSLGWSGIAYHYYIRRDGSIYRGRPENSVGGHAKGYNERSIGICFEGNFETETMGSAQKTAGLALVGELKRKYPGIRVGGHRDYAATACPGRNFPLEEMKEARELDNTHDSYAAEAVAWAQEKNILRGDERGDLKLHEAVTRQDMLVFLHRAMEVSADVS